MYAYFNIYIKSPIFRKVVYAPNNEGKFRNVLVIFVHQLIAHKTMNALSMHCITWVCLCIKKIKKGLFLIPYWLWIPS